MTKTMRIGAVLATSAMVLSQFAAIPAYACEWSWCGDGGSSDDNSVYIKVENDGSIKNETTAKADTGDNWAGGSYGGNGGYAGNGGDGGRAEVEGGSSWCWSCCETCGGDSGSEANGGDGGNGGDANGGDGGPGGLVDTGDADVSAGSVNTLNTVDIEVEGCGCEDQQDECGCIPPWLRRDVDNSVTVKIDNDGRIKNETEAKADTGDNDADGSYGGDGGTAGDGGKGGKAEVGDDEGDRCGCEWDLSSGGGDANGGQGADGGDANGGDGDVGGTIRTGDARSESGSVNLMNTVLVRVTR